MAEQITRITLFKVPDEENQNKILALYRQMPQKALKVSQVNTSCSTTQLPVPVTFLDWLFETDALQDGKPYILSVKAGLAVADQRAQGFTVAAVSTFASKGDMDYYDNGCAAHQELKSIAKNAHQGFAMVFFPDRVEQY